MAEHSKEQDLRSQHIAARKKHMADMAKQKRPRVRVTPGDDDMRKVLKHPNGVGFPASGSVEWPHDQFTRLRIRDGSVKVEEQRDHEDKHDRKAEKVEEQRDEKRRGHNPPSAEPA
jgi:hypothetical protein